MTKNKKEFIDKAINLIKMSSLSGYKIANDTGITEATIGNYRNGKTRPTLANANIIVDYLESFNTKSSSPLAVSDPEMPYLVTKCGTKYYECKNGMYRMIVPFIPINAYAGYVDNYVDAVYIDKLEEREFYVREIHHGRYFAFEIKGDSMDDGSKMSIANKDIVLARVLSLDLWENLHIEKYKRWIIVHKNTILCKQIVGQTDNGEIVCHSLNPSPEYSNFNVSLNDIKQLLNIVKVERDEDNLF